MSDRGDPLPERPVPCFRLLQKRPDRLPRRGVTLVELLLVVTLAGIVLALAVPRLGRAVDHQVARSVLDRFVAEVYLARVTAVRTGERVTVTLDRPDPAACIPSYTVSGTGGATRTMRVEPSGACLRSNGTASFAFDGRGMPVGAANRTLSVERRGARVEAVMARTGRIYRRY